MIRFLQKIEAFLRPLLKKSLPKHTFERVTFFLRLGYWPDLRRPKSINEKISYQKINDLPAGVEQLVDKLEVREFVRNRIGDQYLTPLAAVYDSPEEVDLASLPKAFALKYNGGSGTNLIVRDKSQVSPKDIVEVCKNWTAKPFSQISHTYETIYDSIEPKIFAEALLTPLVTLQEYKIWCFQGEPALIQVSARLQGIERFKFYDLDWKDCEFSVYHKNTDFAVQRPPCLDKLIDLARRLSQGFPFVRVDLNVSEDFGITFGELTFHPGGGRLRFFPREFDFSLGERF